MFSKTDEKMMRIALEEGRTALHEGEIPVGAVLAHGDVLVARAHNTKESACDPTAHAEINALRLAAQKAGRWRLSDLTLYVTLEPCPMCAGAIAMSGVKRLVFGAYDKQYGCAGSIYRLTEDPVFPNFCPADGGLMEEECASSLHAFWKNTRKKTGD
ncbi:MAG: nucleoside deaminase [Clostridia bacterium]|nr:nucleoside deaminase [Clostridia bacterium]